MMILLEPVLDEPGTLRLVGDGTPIHWSLDGQSLGWASGAEPVEVQAGAGRHEVWAEGAQVRLALARAEPSGSLDARWVPAWTEAAPAQPAPLALPRWLLPLALLGAGVGVMRRSKAP
jgi:hypothetical protein